VRWRAKKLLCILLLGYKCYADFIYLWRKETFVKTLFKVLVVLLLLLVLAAAALFVWLDPNVFKPRIKALAAEQGIALEMAGDISWQFWPSLGVEVADISVASLSAPDDQLAHLRSASLLVATRPLFNQELRVEHLIIDGATATFELDESGASNWSRLASEARQRAEQAQRQAELEGFEADQVPADAIVTDDPTAKAAPPAEPSTPPQQERELNLAVDTISITRAHVRYQNAALERSAEVTLNTFKLTGFNADNRPFALKGDWQARIKDPAMLGERELQASGELGAEITLAADLSHITASGGELTLETRGLGQAASVSAGFTVDISNPMGAMLLNGQLALEPVNLKNLLASVGQTPPVTAESDALTHLSVNASLTGSANAIKLAPITLELDDTTVNGELALTDFTRMSLKATLTGDQINLDHYLPPPAPQSPTASAGDTASPKTTPAPDPAANEPLIPLDAVRALNANLRLDLNQAVVSGLTLQNLRLRLTAADGLVQLTDASLNAYQGTLQASGQLNGRGKTASINGQADITGLNLAPLLSDLQLDENMQLSGQLNLKASASTQGVTQPQLLQAAVADATFNGAQVTVAPINVEQYFCQAVELTRALRNKDDKDKTQDAAAHSSDAAAPEQDWPELTEMRELQGQAQLREQVITIKSFTAGVEQLLMGLKGQIDLAQQRFDLRLPLTLEQPTTSAEGCTVNSNYWVNRSLSLLRCRGDISTLAPAKDCRLDSKALESLLSDYTKQRLKDELIRKLSDDESNTQDDSDDPAKAVVKGLLNQFLNKDKKDNP
jgi:AsmA protein